MDKVRIGLYGTNGHQIQRALIDHPLAECVATAAFDREALPPPLQDDDTIRHYDTLDALLADGRVDLVSLCSPRRRDQAQEAIRSLEAGKHVYAEKPCAMTEAELDAILATAHRTGKVFHEMAGTAFEQPYLAMRELVQAGTLGTVVQVLAQKSYPYHDRRPQDEDVDGGLLLQVGVHALRFVEHVAGTKVAGTTVPNIWAVQTKLGNPEEGELRMATSMMMRLDNGGVAAVICNYLNPPAFGLWGNEALRIFGTEGFVEAVDGGTRSRLVLNNEDRGPLHIAGPGKRYLDMVLRSLIQGEPMPLTLEDEVHPTRVLIRARADARARE
ncbi:MAG: Gfo/Idh/MocA family protein [Anaerolineae bacterium]